MYCTFLMENLVSCTFFTFKSMWQVDNDKSKKILNENSFVSSGLFEMSRESKVGVSLYSRKVLIKSKADNIMPNWLRFMKGKF